MEYVCIQMFIIPINPNFLRQNTPYREEPIVEDASKWNNLGFVYLAQDVRGRFRSNGAYAFVTKVGNDSLDSI